MTVDEQMEQAYEKNPELTRAQLIEATACSSGRAQRFLAKKRGVVKREGKPGPAKGSAKPNSENQKMAGLMEKAGLKGKELESILQSMKGPALNLIRPAHVWGRSSFKFACLSDTHFGHVKSRAEWWLRACDLIAQEECQLVLHPGDITEGMSGRQGHFYELEAVGVTAQVELAAARLALLPCPIEAITGNHDAWAFKAVGVDVGEALELKLPGHYTNLGPDEADVVIDGITIKLWHGGDGASYATSYRTQKFIEGLTGGEKPHILLSGHAHKAILHECRNVMVFEAGTMCGQTGWMRGKKLAAHVGFWIIEVWPASDGGIERIKSEWVPFFKE